MNLAPFLDPLAGAIVLGGTGIATLLRAPASDVGRALAALRIAGRRPFAADTLLLQIEALSRISSKHGVVQLDRAVIADTDVGVAVRLLVDGNGGEVVATRLEATRLARFERQRAAADVWTAAAEFAPAMGMVGTLVGLVRLFTAMTDPAAIGGAMAVAVLATLYGALLGNLVFLPIAARLRRLARAEYLERGRLIAPLAKLAAREAPRRVRERAA